jgi:hypothetical protein
MLAMIVPLQGNIPGLSPGNELPGGPPVYPSHGLPGFPPHPSHGLPGSPGHPSQGLPWAPGFPGNDLPGGDHVSGQPIIPPLPPTVNPPPAAVWPGVPVYPASPTHPIALPPGTVYPPLPPTVHGKVLALVAIVGVGYRWLVIDADANRPSTGPVPPPTAAPK